MPKIFIGKTKSILLIVFGLSKSKSSQFKTSPFTDSVNLFKFSKHSITTSLILFLLVVFFLSIVSLSTFLAMVFAVGVASSNLFWITGWI